MRIVNQCIRVLKALSALSVVCGAITFVFLLQLIFEPSSKQKSYGTGFSNHKKTYIPEKLHQRYFKLIKYYAESSQRYTYSSSNTDIKYHPLFNYSLWRPGVEESGIERDRIVEQLVWFMDPDIRERIQRSKPKNILLLDYLSKWNIAGKENLVCPGGSHNCILHENRNNHFYNPKHYKGMKIDAVVLSNWQHDFVKNLPESALKISYFLESPWSPSKEFKAAMVEVTEIQGYSVLDIVAPYAKWVYYNESITSRPQEINYAEGKRDKVAIFVSNCLSYNDRLAYAKELSKYIQVDIYGQCGSLKCPKRDESLCFDKLQKQYKFYLSFENANCKDYITEKFFYNALQHNVVPIVLGGNFMDYKAVAPHHSFIHVDSFASPKDLALYLIYLDETDAMYNEYFQWKGTGEFINTHFLCRVCAMLNYADLEHEPLNKKTVGFPWTFRNKDLCLQSHRWNWNKEDINSPENWDSTLFVNDRLTSKGIEDLSSQKIFPVYKKSSTDKLH